MPKEKNMPQFVEAETVKVARLEEQMKNLNDNFVANVNEIKRDVAVIKEKLDDSYMRKEDAKKMWDEAMVIAKTADETHKNLESKIRKLEDWKIWVVAYATGISATVYFLLNYFFKGKI